MTTVYARLQVRRDTSANWEAENPILADGEIGFATDAKAEKIGDGLTAWNDLLSRPSQEQILAVQAAAEQAASDAQQRLDGATAAQGSAEAARDETQTLRDQTYTYKQDVASAIVYQDLASIAEQKAITMVAGFIYDTRLDTDGGAWRDRCQGTSWYNEPLNTPTRGTRRDFPTVAVIIAESAKITIFDGDDPSLPEWLSFTITSLNAGANMVFGSGVTGGCVAFLNGKLVIGTVGTSYGGATIIDFAKDEAIAAYRYTGYGRYNGTIAERNDGKGFSGQGSIQLAGNNANSVAMTVLPDAPVDPATGLQVPTIYVQTYGGTSRIADDGTVSSSNLGWWEAGQEIGIWDGYVVKSGGGNASYNGVWARPVTDTLDSNWTRWDTPAVDVIYNGKQAYRAMRSTTCLVFTHPNPAAPASALFSHVTSSWATGWMPGDVRGAFLASTDETDLVSDTPIDASFDTDLSAFTATTNVTYDGALNAARIAEIGGVDGVARIDGTTVVAGAAYVLTFDIVDSDDPAAKITVSGDKDSQGSDIFGVIKSGIGPQSISFVAPTTNFNLGFNVGGGSNYYTTIDNIALERADPDRSVKGNAVAIKGTIARSLDTGGELAWYTPDTDLTVSLDSDISASGMVTWWEKVSGVAHLYQKDLSGGQSYVDGRPGTPPADTITFAGADMTIKAGKTLKLVRPSATICSANQAAFMWQTERPIVVGGLPCTLYGTSDAVTALANDPVTGLLHAGTSAGRSDFDGLARVGNTQTPVAKAISASGGMILEG